MNDKDIRPVVREWIEGTFGGQVEDEITVSGYRLDLASLRDYITGFEIKGDTDSIDCPHFREQISGYSRVCRRSYLILTLARPRILGIGMSVLPWHWGICFVTSHPRLTVYREASGSGPDYSRQNREGSGGDDLVTQVGGQLNPTWTEWLMGFPLGWTELSAWAMQWYRSKRRSRLKGC